MGLARFNLYMLSIHHILTSPRSKSRLISGIRPTELAFILCYWHWFGYGIVWLTLPNWPTRIGFILISHIITMPLHVQITLSLGHAYSGSRSCRVIPQHQLRTTVDVDCPE
jgi:delta8-fatty-acid desaturase